MSILVFDCGILAEVLRTSPTTRFLEYLRPVLLYYGRGDLLLRAGGRLRHRRGGSIRAQQTAALELLICLIS